MSPVRGADQGIHVHEDVGCRAFGGERAGDAGAEHEEEDCASEVELWLGQQEEDDEGDEGVEQHSTPPREAREAERRHAGRFRLAVGRAGPPHLDRRGGISPDRGRWVRILSLPLACSGREPRMIAATCRSTGGET